MINLVFLLLAAASPAYTIPATILPTHEIRVQVRVNDAGPIAVLFRTAAGYQEADGLIGGDFLYRFLVTIDYPGRRLFLEPNRNFNDPPFAYDGSAMSIQPNDGGFFVKTVLPGGPADLAGFKEGDVVLAVNGESAAQLTRDRIREKLLYRSSGTSVIIRIRRGDQELTYTIELKPLL